MHHRIRAPEQMHPRRASSREPFAILAARAGASDRCFDRSDGQVATTALEGKRRLKPGEPATGNGDIGGTFSFERRGGRHAALVSHGFVEPPGAIGRSMEGRKDLRLIMP